MKICSACGQPVIATDELILPPIKRRIFDAVRRRPGINSESLRVLVWAADPDGGPENPKVLHVHVYQLNRLLAPQGLEVRGSHSAGYRVRVRTS
jgi:hypothetical protein